MLKVLNHRCPLDSVDDTFITLILKVNNLSKVGEYRPISLCNVIYKIITKVLANRLKIILPKIISSNQSAFVPDRLITDNILIAYEILHSLYSWCQGNKRYMALNLKWARPMTVWSGHFETCDE